MKPSLTRKFAILSIALAAIMTFAPAARAVDPTPNPSMQWQLGSVVSPWNLTTDRFIELPVTIAAGSNIENIVLTQSTLIDTASSGRVLHMNNICLLTEPSTPPKGSCPQAFPVTANKSDGKKTTVPGKKTIWLYVNEDFESNGVFTGSLFFDTEPLTDTKSITLKIQRTSCAWQWLGVGIIVVGVALAWLVTVFGRSRIARDQALMPALALLDKLRHLGDSAAQLPASLAPHATAFMAAIENLIDSLSTDALDRQDFLPPPIPAFGPSIAKTAEYQFFLTQTSQKTEDLDILLSEGITLLAARWSFTVQGPELEALQRAIGSIDQLATSLPTDTATLRLQVAGVLQSWNNAHEIRSQAIGVAANPIEPQSPGQKSFIAVRLEVQTITILFWLIWGLLSVIIGASVLIIPVPGFGSITDLIRCLLWGFGLPVAGSSIQNLTTGTLNTQLGVSVTRN